SLTEPQICTLIESAAGNGDGISQATLGEMYYSGIGKTKNNETAVQWLQKAADRGVPGALFRLGQMYVQGEQGVDRDVSYGCKLLRQADQAGHPGAGAALDRYCGGDRGGDSAPPAGGGSSYKGHYGHGNGNGGGGHGGYGGRNRGSNGGSDNGGQN